MKKRIVAFLLAVSLAFIMLPPMRAAAIVFTIEWEYKLDNDGNATITSFPNYDMMHAIQNGLLDRIKVNGPTSIDGHEVVAIGDYAFSNCGSVVSVNIPDSVTKVGKNPFAGSNISVYVGQKNKGLAIIDGILYSKSDKRLVYCPNDYEAEKVTIPDGIKTIGAMAFKNCENIKTVVIPGSVVEIEDYAFCGASVNDVKLPNSVATLGQGVFKDSDISSITLPSGITEIKDGFFEDCNMLQKVVIPDSVKRIGDNAFKCGWENRKLTTLVLPDGLEEIGRNAFERLSALESVTIPASVSKIGEGAFNYCSSLKSITVAAENARYSAEDNLLYDEERATLIAAGAETTKVTVKDGTQFIAAYAFAGKNVQSVVMPDTVLDIGECAFSSCSNLEKVELSESLVKIGDSAFYRCKKLSKIALPNSLEKIGKECFCSSGLTSIEIPESVKIIGEDAFRYCESLEKVVLPATEIQFGDGIFDYCENANYDVPSGSSAEEYLIEFGYYDWLSA